MSEGTANKLDTGAHSVRKGSVGYSAPVGGNCNKEEFQVKMLSAMLAEREESDQGVQIETTCHVP